jgi:hypothetical protein
MFSSKAMLQALALTAVFHNNHYRMMARRDKRNGTILNQAVLIL